jgi:DNA repair ATPase RecN
MKAGEFLRLIEGTMRDMSKAELLIKDTIRELRVWHDESKDRNEKDQLRRIMNELNKISEQDVSLKKMLTGWLPKIRKIR